MTDRGKPRVLFTTPVLSYPPKGGPALRIANAIKALATVAEITLVSRVSRERLGDEAESFFRQYCHHFLYAPSTESSTSGAKKNQSTWTSLFGKAPVDSVNQRDAEFIAGVAREQDVDLIWLGYGNVSYPLLRALRSQLSLPLVADTDSVWSRFVLRGLPYQQGIRRKWRTLAEGMAKWREEVWGTRTADVTTAVSQIDLAYYRRISRGRHVMLFSNVIDLQHYDRSGVSIVAQSPSVYLAGSFFSATSPMAEAARWLLEQVMPRVWQSIPAAKLYLVGQSVRKVMSAVQDERVLLVESPESVLPFLMGATVSVVPLKFESGTRFKILEAAACRVPVVSTTLGAEGINVSHEEDILIADTPEQFAQAIIRVIEEPHFARAMAENAFRTIAEANDLRKAASEAKAILEWLLAHN